MTQPQQDPNDPLTLLPTVLKHLTALQRKPSLAAPVLAAVRKACRTQKAHLFVTPLLHPLTAVALTTPALSLRVDAANTCAALASALITRRVAPLATAYLLDVVELAERLIAHPGPDPLPFRLPRFVALADVSHAAQDAAPPPDATVTPDAVEALLHLLALFTPATHPPLADAPMPIQLCASSRLWLGVGARARAAVLRLASSRALLASRCGPSVARAAACVLERAFDPAAGCAVPVSVGERLHAMLEDILSKSFPPAEGACPHARAALYRLAQLSAPTGMISATLWASCGIREAAGDGVVADELTALSRSGLVTSYFVGEATVSDAVPEPPRKRPRVAQRSSVDEREASSLEHSQVTVVDESSRAVAGLQQTLQSLESIYACAEHASSMQLLARATALTGDSLNNIIADRVSCPQSLEEWLSFAQSLSRIVRDISTCIRTDISSELWEATLTLAQSCLRLAAALCCSQSLRSIDSAMDNVFDSSSAVSDCRTLLGAVVVMLKMASVGLRSTPDFPVGPLAQVALSLGDLTLRENVEVPDDEALSDAYRSLQDFALETSTFDTSSRALLLRSSFHMLFASTGPLPVQQAGHALPHVSGLISVNVNDKPDLATAATYALADIICARVGCRRKHGSGNDGTHSRQILPLAIDAETWRTCFGNVSSAYERNLTNETFMAPAMRCIGVLAMHAPKGNISQCASLLTKALWDNNAPEARLVAHAFLCDLLDQRDAARKVSPSGEKARSDGRRPPFGQMEDTWDGMEGTFDGEGDDSDVSRVLGLEVQRRREEWNQSEDPTGHLVTCRDVEAAALLLRLPPHEQKTAFVVGFAATLLLSAAMSELAASSSFQTNSTIKQKNVATMEYEQSSPTLSAWNQTLLSVSQFYGQFSEEPHTGKCKGSRRGWKLTLVEPPGTAPQTEQVLAQLLASFFLSRMPEWLPHALPRMLDDDSFAQNLARVLTDGNAQALWTRVPRHTMGMLLRSENEAHLEALALKVNRPQAVLVEKVCADALARAAMNQEGGFDLDLNGPNSLILQSLEQPLEEIVSRRAGKIVQRLVMEFGGSKEVRAKRGLVSLARILKTAENSNCTTDEAPGVLVTKHFMLVMDAVNRGLFHSKAALNDRFRYLRLLDVVLSLSSRQLHLFVPKILATLKMALDTDRGNEAFRVQTLSLWTSFLQTLGPGRAIPHLGSILSILLPFCTSHERILVGSLTALVEDSKTRQIQNRPEIVLLLRLGDHPALSKAADTLEERRGRNGHDKRDGKFSSGGKLSGKELSALSRHVCSIISHHENGTIEILAAKYLLQVLRSDRDMRSSESVADGQHRGPQPGENVKELATTIGNLVDQLALTRNAQCQDVIMQCIGEIGALDPIWVSDLHRSASIDEVGVKGSLTSRYPRNVHALVALLLDDFLVPTLTKGEKNDKSSSRQNRVGLVIQELLRVCGCRHDTAARASKTNRNRKNADGMVDWDKVLVGDTDAENAIFFWENLLSTTRNVAEPYLAEPFDVQQYKDVFGATSAGDALLACQPVWPKVKAASSAVVPASAQEWRRQMVVQLVDFIGKQGRFGETLKALRPVLRYEDNVAAFVFPLVVATALDIQHEKQSFEVQKFLISEISSVFREGVAPQPLFDLFDTLRQWREERCQSQARLMMTSKSGNGSNTTGSHRRRIPLDVYVDIARDQDPLSAFVDLEGREAPELSLSLQARAALSAKSFSRAIMMAESHVRNLRNRRGFREWPSFIEETIAKESLNPDTAATSESQALSVLQLSFAEIEDSENMTGIAALRSTSTLAERVLDNEAGGRYDEALITYERALGEQPRSIRFHEGFLSCLMTLGHWETMLSHAEGLASSSTLSETELREVAKAHGIAAAWRLGRWEKVREFGPESLEYCQSRVTSQFIQSWLLRYNICLGKMFVSLRDRKLSQLHVAAADARRHILTPMTKAAREGYSRTYPLIALLHTLSDIEDASDNQERLSVPNSNISSQGTDSRKRGSTTGYLISLRSRMDLTSSSLKVREPMISAKRVCFELMNRQNDAAQASLELAKIAKEGDNLRAAAASAYRATSTASINNDVLNASVLEMAHIRRAQGDCSGALVMVKNEIDRLSNILNGKKSQDGPTSSTEGISDRLCTAFVVAGSWIEESGSEPSDVILHYFQQGALHGPSRDQPFYALGRHYDSLLQAAANSDDKISFPADVGPGRGARRSIGVPTSGVLNYNQYVPLIIKSFATALVNGHTRIFEALPRMLTVWFDYQTELEDPNFGAAAVAVEADVKREMKKAFESVPPYMWMTAVPQLMSRILHPRKQVREDLTNLLARLVGIFPDQCFWTILPSCQLKTQDRKKAAANVLNHSIVIMKKRSKQGEDREKGRVLRSKIQGALTVVQSFVDICSTLLPKEKRGRKENCAKEFKDLKVFLRTNAEDNPIIPTLNSLTVHTPSGNESGHRPFAVSPVRIVDIEDFVLVMVSLMRPRRIGLIGSDGLAYRYLAKKENQGDMRKDSRLVELITVVNRLLSKDPVSRPKKLELKTYAVLPLSEETGMIEWVNDLCPIRNLVRDQQNRFQGVPDTAMIQSKYQAMKDHKAFLTEWAFQKFPPVLDKFFLQTFGGGADPQSWLAARNLWTQSTAVWSMVGYVVGLGDRHGENVLIETTTGRCVHVDFAMLFDKGLKLKVPEIVPFRLTRNMVTAMGIAGYEGVYRCASETVLGIMRREADALLGVLESFLHDPLADWGRSDARGGRGGVSASKEAWQTRAAVKAKLTGMVDHSGLPLSITGQVQRLIHEATSLDNLSQMYLWWSAWI